LREFAGSIAKERFGVALILVAIGIFVSLEAGDYFRFESTGVATIWFANAVLLTALLLVPPGRWWLVLLAAVPAFILSKVLGSGLPFGISLGAFAANCAEALIAAVLLRRVEVGPLTFSSFRQVALFLGLAVIAAPAVAATLGAATIHFGLPGKNLWAVWQTWFFANALGQLALTPVLLTWISGRDAIETRLSALEYLEPLSFVALLAATVIFIFVSETPHHGGLPVILYLPFPFLIWSAVRFGPRIATLTGLFFVVFALRISFAHPHSAALPISPEYVASLQSFLAVALFTTLTLAAVIADRRRTEKRLRGAVESLQEGFALFDPEDRIVAANQVFQRLNPDASQFIKEGKTYEALIRAYVDAGYIPEAEGREESFIRERMEQHRNPGEPILRHLEDGKWIIIKESRTPEGGIASSFVDVTELKQAEAEATAAVTILERIFTSQTAAIFVVEMPDRVIQAINPAGERIFGYATDEVIGNNFALLHASESNFETFGAKMLPALDRDGVFKTQFDMRRKDGSIFPTDITITEIRDDDGERTQLVSVVHDITSDRAAEAALRASRARLEGIFDIAPEAVIAIDENMEIQLFNQSAERVFGYSAEEILGRSLDVLIPARFRGTHGGHVDAFDASPDIYRTMDSRDDIVGLRRDGTEFPASASVSKLEIDGGKVFTVMLTDITDRRRAQDALIAAKAEAEQANLAKSRFLASMSHELRTPLNAILGFAEILNLQILGPLGDPKYQEYADDIHSSGEHLLSLVNHLLDISTIEAGELSLTKEPLETGEITEESINLVAARAEKGGIKLVARLPDSLPLLHADRRALRQILLNLLSNALKYTPEGGTVTVSASALNGTTTFEIDDTGRGISADKLPELTNPFTRADHDPLQATEGWGLGLAITNSLVELHEGTLEIESKIGVGTTVRVSLPNGADGRG